MENAQRELVCLLVDRIHFLGLISDSTCSGALDLIHAATSFPAFFRDPACLTEEADRFECA